LVVFILELYTTILKELIDDGVGVLSLIKKLNPFLLWSHHSDDHCGFSIGYNQNIFFQDFKTKYSSIRKIYFDIDVILFCKSFDSISRESFSLVD
jgi:hypothetical protein